MTEVLMSARRWDAIDFGRVASLCLLRHRAAFQRHCAPALRRAVALKRVNAGQVYPHELVRKLLDNADAAYLCEVLQEPVAALLSEDVKALFELQWQKLKDDVRAKMLVKLAKAQAKAAAVAAASAPAASASAASAAPAGGSGGVAEEEKAEAVAAKGRLLPVVPLTNIVPVVDMSGSMHGEPMAVAVAFGILLAELSSSPHFRNRVLTFAARPEWFALDPTVYPTLESKVSAIRGMQDRCGETTNLGLAMERLLSVAIDHQLKQHELPELVVFSDMQFTEATGGGGGAPSSWETEYEATRAKFAAAGYDLPLVTFWNLRSVDQSAVAAAAGALDDTGAMPVAADAPGVRLLSGYSQHLMKALLNGEVVEEEQQEERDGSEDEAGDETEDGEEGAAGKEGEDGAGGVGVEAAEGGDGEEAGDESGATLPPPPAELFAHAPPCDKKATAPRRVRGVNALATLRRALDDEAYDDIRVALDQVQEHLLLPDKEGAAGGGGGGAR